jgi:membrane carboxypeptidase/penicillin-binding protein
VLRIYDTRRRTWSDNPPAVTPVISPAAAYVTTQMLRDVMVYGTAKSLRKFSQARPAAGKTGTTDDYRDAWFIGYTPGVVTGIWVGHDKPRPGGKGFTGGAVAAPIWEQFMVPALAGRPGIDFARPETVVTVAVDPSTGYRAAPECPEQGEEFFVAGTEPAEYCPVHGGELLLPEQPDLPLPEGEGQGPAVTDNPM